MRWPRFSSSCQDLTKRKRVDLRWHSRASSKTNIDQKAPKAESEDSDSDMKPSSEDNASFSQRFKYKSDDVFSLHSDLSDEVVNDVFVPSSRLSVLSTSSMEKEVLGVMNNYGWKRSSPTLSTKKEQSDTSEYDQDYSRAKVKKQRRQLNHSHESLSSKHYATHSRSSSRSSKTSTATPPPLFRNNSSSDHKLDSCVPKETPETNNLNKSSPVSEFEDSENVNNNSPYKSLLYHKIRGNNSSKRLSHPRNIQLSAAVSNLSSPCSSFSGPYDNMCGSLPLRSNPTVSPPTLTAAQDSIINEFYNEKMRECIVDELVTTELTYCCNLSTLINVIAKAFKEVTFMPLKDRCAIFPNVLPRLKNLHLDFYSKLEQCRSWPTQSFRTGGNNVSSIDTTQTEKYAISRCSIVITFLELIQENVGEFFDLYSDYLYHFTQSVAIIAKYMKRSARFRQLVKTLQNKEQCANLDLIAYLVTPVQRLPRYLLLVKQLVKFSTSCSPDEKEALGQVESQLDHFLDRMNSDVNLVAHLPQHDLKNETHLFHPDLPARPASLATPTTASFHAMFQLATSPVTPTYQRSASHLGHSSGHAGLEETPTNPGKEEPPCRGSLKVTGMLSKLLQRQYKVDENDSYKHFLRRSSTESKFDQSNIFSLPNNNANQTLTIRVDRSSLTSPNHTGGPSDWSPNNAAASSSKSNSLSRSIGDQSSLKGSSYKSDASGRISNKMASISNKLTTARKLKRHVSAYGRSRERSQEKDGRSSSKSKPRRAQSVHSEVGRHCDVDFEGKRCPVSRSQTFSEISNKANHSYQVTSSYNMSSTRSKSTENDDENWCRSSRSTARVLLRPMKSQKQTRNQLMKTEMQLENYSVKADHPIEIQKQSVDHPKREQTQSKDDPMINSRTQLSNNQPLKEQMQSRNHPIRADHSINLNDPITLHRTFSSQNISFRNAVLPPTDQSDESDTSSRIVANQESNASPTRQSPMKNNRVSRKQSLKDSFRNIFIKKKNSLKLPFHHTAAAHSPDSVKLNSFIKKSKTFVGVPNYSTIYNSQQDTDDVEPKYFNNSVVQYSSLC